MSAPMTAQKAAGGTLTLAASFANGAVAGTRVNMTIQWDPSITAANFYIIPDSEYWLITDCWAASAAGAGTDVNPIIEFYKDQDRVLDRSRPMNAVIITSAQRPPGLNSNLGYQGGSHLTCKAVSTAAAAAARSVTVYATYEKHS